MTSNLKTAIAIMKRILHTCSSPHNGGHNASKLLTINQRWAGDRLAGFVNAVLKKCSCSMALIGGRYCSRPRSKNKRDIKSFNLY